jgi:hypothetical protein
LHNSSTCHKEFQTVGASKESVEGINEFLPVVELVKSVDEKTDVIATAQINKSVDDDMRLGARRPRSLAGIGMLVFVVYPLRELIDPDTKLGE